MTVTLVALRGIIFCESQAESLVELALGLDVRGIGVDPRQGQLSLLQNVQTTSGVPPFSYSMATGECFPGSKMVGA